MKLSCKIFLLKKLSRYSSKIIVISHLQVIVTVNNQRAGRPARPATAAQPLCATQPMLL